MLDSSYGNMLNEYLPKFKMKKKTYSPWTKMKKKKE